MKPPATKKNRTRSRGKPPSASEVEFVLSALASFGGRAELVVPPDGETREAWRVSRAKQVAVPLRVLDHAAATLLALLACVPPEHEEHPGVTPDPAVDRALKLAQFLELPKTQVARSIAASEAWRKHSPQARQRIQEVERRERKEGVDLHPEKYKIIKELDEAVDRDTESRTQRIRRAMNPSRRRAKS
jgi:hypothetical protein